MSREGNDVTSDRVYLDLAARLGLRGAGRVEPNPMVGAVVVRDGRVIGLGHHRRFGGPHAEAEAITDAHRRGEDVRGATMYCTLEPCATAGKQPACAASVVRAGIARVVYARADDSPGKGGGATLLLGAGIDAELSDLSRLATGLAEPWARGIRTGRPWVIAKWAQTLDGRLATRSGESKWISGETSRRRVHRLRARVDAILTGIGTVLADDPMLTARGVRVRRVAKRVVADSDLDVPLGAGLVVTARETPTIVACDRDFAASTLSSAKRAALGHAGVTVMGVPASVNGRGLDLASLLTGLRREHGVTTLLVEAGPALLGSLLEQDLIDEVVAYVAPMLLGDDLARAVASGRVAESLLHARRLRLWRTRVLGDDVELTYRRP